MYRVVLFSLLAPLALNVHANDFPTQTRVEFVLGCMDRHGGQNYEHMFSCVCTVDKIASQMTHAEYTHADTMSVMIRTPGERGGAFRDAPGARKEVRRLKEIREEAENSCFVKRVPVNKDG